MTVVFQIQWIWHNLKGYRAVYITALTLSIVCNILYLTTPYFSSQIVDVYINNEHAAENLANDRRGLIMLLIGMVGFTLLRTVLQYACNMTYEYSSQGMIYKIRNHLYKSVQEQDMDFYDKHRTGDLMNRLTGDLDMVRHTVSWVFKGAVESFSLFTASMVYFFSINFKMALLLLSVTPFIFIVTIMLRRVTRPVYVDLRERLAKMNTDAQENISGNRVVKAFAREDYEIQKFGESNKNYSSQNKKASLLWLKFSPLMDTLANLLSVIMLLGGGIFLIKGSLTMGEYVAISGLIWAISNPVRNLGVYVNDWQRAMASAMKIIEVSYSKPRIADRDDAVDIDNRLHGDIEFKNVSFSYEGKRVLNNVSFTIKAGETVAIMGETGSGKTTLINLIPRFYDVEEGAVLVDGVNVRQYGFRQLRENVAMVSQETYIFMGTVAENIAYARPDASREEIIRAAISANAHDFICRMPEGYDTILGSSSRELSGGEKQRISIARAILADPKILILDEATSAVDTETELAIQKSLEKLEKGRTVLSIAHRLSTLRNATHLIVLDEGRITETGTHEELLAKKGTYFKLSELQTKALAMRGIE